MLPQEDEEVLPVLDHCVSLVLGDPHDFALPPQEEGVNSGYIVFISCLKECMLLRNKKEFNTNSNRKMLWQHMHMRGIVKQLENSRRTSINIIHT
jgi:hypothetical protein